MRYFLARLEEQTRVRAYRNYVTDGLMAAFGLEGDRYADLFRYVKEDRSPEEIIDGIKNKLGGMDGCI